MSCEVGLAVVISHACKVAATKLIADSCTVVEFDTMVPYVHAFADIRIVLIPEARASKVPDMISGPL